MERRLAVGASWDETCLERERGEAKLAILFTGTLVPIWIAFDALLEPAWVHPFAAMRLVATAMSWAILLPLVRARSLHALRAWLIGALAWSGATIALMLPHVGHFGAYLFGFSVYFWGVGALFSWPATCSVALFAWLLGVLAAALAFWTGRRDVGDLVMAGFYLGSAAVMATIMTLVRRRLVRAAFEASDEIARRGAEVERALAQLRDAQARLVASEKLSALGRLLAGLSHEINNPLNVLHNNLDFLRDSVERLVAVAHAANVATPDGLAALHARCAELDIAALSSDARDAASLMRAAMDRVRQVHADLRAFVRGDAPDMIRGDIAAGLRATAALLSRGLAAGVRLELELEHLPPIAFQPGQLNQVWHNLIQNGIDAVGDAGAVAVRARIVDGAIEVAVSDTGPGVALALRPRLFEPFFTTKGVGQGTGLGLAMSYQIVERHGGALFLDTAYAGGARFVVHLPIRGAAEELSRSNRAS
jgi:signal transduction histidine kinase